MSSRTKPPISTGLGTAPCLAPSPVASLSRRWGSAVGIVRRIGVGLAATFGRPGSEVWTGAPGPGAEPGFELDHLVELVGRQLGAERVDRLQQVLAALGAVDGVVGKT